VTARQAGSSAQHETVGDAQGRFRREGLAPGACTLEAQAPGFALVLQQVRPLSTRRWFWRSTMELDLSNGILPDPPQARGVVEEDAKHGEVTVDSSRRNQSPVAGILAGLLTAGDFELLDRASVHRLPGCGH